MTFTERQIQPRVIMLSKIGQSQEDKCYIFSHTQNEASFVCVIPCVCSCACAHVCTMCACMIRNGIMRGREEREECMEETVIEYVWRESKRGTMLMEGNQWESDRDLGWIDSLTGNKDACF